jgi:hypothetical protein
VPEDSEKIYEGDFIVSSFFFCFFHKKYTLSILYNNYREINEKPDNLFNGLINV